MSQLPSPGDASVLAELAPLARRAATLDPASLVRIRIEADSATALVRLPFGVLVGRRVAGAFDELSDRVYQSAELIEWLDASVAARPPAGRDGDWRAGLPPERGWQRLETVPDDVVRGLVRSGALALKEAAEPSLLHGVPNAEPRPEVANALLDSIVLTAEQGPHRVEVSLRLLSALVRMGFLARDSHLGVDIAGRWVRLSATYGSAYAERPGLGLGMITPRP